MILTICNQGYISLLLIILRYVKYYLLHSAFMNGSSAILADSHVVLECFHNPVLDVSIIETGDRGPVVTISVPEKEV